MENKQNQPASGANAPGTSKTSNASNQPSGSAASQRASNVQNTATSASSQEDSHTATPEQTPNRTSASLGQGQTHGESQGYRGREDKQQGQSWMDISSWLGGNKEIPQSVKDFGTKALDQVNKLSTTQKVVGGALLLGSIGWLSMRSGSKQPHQSSYRSGADSDSDYRSGKSYGSGDSYGSTSRASRYGADYNTPSAGSDSWSSTSGKDRSVSYRSGSASPSSSLGDDDYSSNL